MLLVLLVLLSQRLVLGSWFRGWQLNILMNPQFETLLRESEQRTRPAPVPLSLRRLRHCKGATPPAKKLILRSLSRAHETAINTKKNVSDAHVAPSAQETAGHAKNSSGAHQWPLRSPCGLPCAGDASSQYPSFFTTVRTCARPAPQTQPRREAAKACKARRLSQVSCQVESRNGVLATTAGAGAVRWGASPRRADDFAGGTRLERKRAPREVK